MSLNWIFELYYNGFLQNIAVPLVACIITGFLPIIFNKSKLKMEHRLQVSKNYTDQRLEAALAIKKVIGKIDIIEIHNLINSEKLGVDKFEAIMKPVIYPAIMRDYRTIKKFYKEYKKVYTEKGDWVNRKSITYLYYGQKYLAMLLILLTEKEDLEIKSPSENCKFIGMILAPDFQKWQRKFDKCLTKSLNKPSLKNYTKTDLLYKYYRSIRDEELKNSILYRLLNSENGVREEINIMLSEEKVNAIEFVLFKRKLKRLYWRIKISIKSFLSALLFQ